MDPSRIKNRFEYKICDLCSFFPVLYDYKVTLDDEETIMNKIKNNNFNIFSSKSDDIIARVLNGIFDCDCYDEECITNETVRKILNKIYYEMSDRLSQI